MAIGVRLPKVTMPEDLFDDFGWSIIELIPMWCEHRGWQGPPKTFFNDQGPKFYCTIFTE